MLKKIAIAAAPLDPAASGEEVFARFQAQPDTLTIAVVDADGRPVGLVDRNDFMLRMAAEFGRALYGKRPVAHLMNAEPLTVEGSVPIAQFTGEVLADRPSDLLRGFIVVEGGRYHGVGHALDLLRAARNEAQSANRAKSEFLANMSHELRTPLNGILGLAGVLAGSNLSAEQREIAGVIEASASTLERLLSDVLDLARVESGKLEIQSEPFDLAELLARTTALFRASAEAKGLAFAAHINPDVPRLVCGDVLRLQQILNNLLSNAVKFTGTGSVEIKVSLWPGAAAQRLCVEVRDTGVGFEQGQAETLFDRFEQGDASVTRRFGGSGLGLPISRTLAQLMGGSLKAFSAAGEGSLFVLRLPCPTATEEEAEAVAERRPVLAPRLRPAPRLRATG